MKIGGMMLRDVRLAADQVMMATTDTLTTAIG